MRKGILFASGFIHESPDYARNQILSIVTLRSNESLANNAYGKIQKDDAQSAAMIASLLAMHLFALARQWDTAGLRNLT